MKAVSAGVRVAILFLLMAVGGYIVWKNLGQNPAGKSSSTLFAKFRDASGLPKGSKVVIAGLPKGEVTDLSVEGRYAKVTFKVDDSIDVWSSAVVVKKATSLLGDNYLEIDPGEEVRQAPDGTKKTFTILGPRCKPDPDSEACRQVTNVVEATTPDQLLHRIEQTLPNVDKVLESVRDLSEDLRNVVNGPMKNVAARVDTLVERESGRIEDIIARVDSTTKNLDALSASLKKTADAADPEIQKIITNADQASEELKTLVADAKTQVDQTGDAVRQKLDNIDGITTDVKSIGDKIDQDKGTLGRLVNDPTIADNVEAITDDAKGFLGTLFGLKAYVGLRTEYNFVSGLTRSYVSVELHTRPDKFYLIELEKGPRGDYPDVSLTFDPTIDPNHWIRKAVIQDHIRFTFQFAKRFHWLTLRYGLKESTGGVGADADFVFMGQPLKFSADVFDASFDQYPRVKLALAYEVFRHIYVYGGVDELLNSPKSLDIVTGDTDVPSQFSKFTYGRDYFMGAMLRFNDEDLSALLTVGGAALAGAAK